MAGGEDGEEEAASPKLRTVYLALTLTPALADQFLLDVDRPSE